MKCFCTKIVLFFTGLAAINLAFYAFISAPVLLDEYLIHQKSVNGQYSRVLFADSHGNAVRQEHLNKINVYNASNDADSYYDIYFKLTYLINMNMKIDMVLITVDDHILSEYREKKNNIDRSVLYSDFPTYRETFSSTYSGYIYMKYLRTYMPFLNTSNSILFMRYLRSCMISLFKYDTVIASGPAWSELNESQRIKESEARFATHFEGEGQSDKLKWVLGLILQRCRENGINVIGLKFPLTKAYISTIGDTNFGADTFIEVNNVQVIDLKGLFEDCAECFKDQDHLNEFGSKKFVDALARATGS